VQLALPHNPLDGGRLQGWCSLQVSLAFSVLRDIILGPGVDASWACKYLRADTIAWDGPKRTGKAEKLSGVCRVTALKGLQIPARTCRLGNFGNLNVMQIETRKTLLDRDLE